MSRADDGWVLLPATATSATGSGVANVAGSVGLRAFQREQEPGGRGRNFLGLGPRFVVCPCLLKSLHYFANRQQFALCRNKGLRGFCKPIRTGGEG